LFTIQFQDFANQVIAVSQINAAHTFDTYESFSLQLTSFALGTGAVWPYVTLPQFEAQASQALQRTGAIFITLTPFVKGSQIAEWESFSVENPGWIEEGFKFNGTKQEAPTDIVRPFMWEGFVETKRVEAPPPDSVLAPIWQVAPIVEFFFLPNFNAVSFDYFERVYSEVKEAKKAVLAEVLDFDTTEAPASYMAAPVYQTNEKDSELVAMVTAVLPWHTYFERLLPEGVDPLFLVVSNTCNQTFTYEIHGPDITYLGVGDLHDNKYTHHEIVTELTSFVSVSNCVYTFHIYPSGEFENAYVTNRPWLYTAAVVFIFALTVAVFILYDFLVERRQDNVVTTANRSNAIVNSLFPATVRDRMMAENEEKDKETGFGSKSNRDELLKFPRGDTADIRSTKPIADLFPHATVMFADIAGFTAWSSVREPTQVFVLLETVYNVFDKLAKRRRVFKVETIGDCYVAVAGLPEERKDHASVMARFARDCMLKMNEVVQKLEITLGPDTADLSMRFGLHSGPVTAGVLRGEKSRFQLFGDTVNTASRMESTGMKNRIHVSHDTSQALISIGKAHWVVPRESTVSVKGKGELQTYWLSFGASSVTQSTGTPESMDPLIVEPEAIHNDVDTCKDKKRQRLIYWNVDRLQQLLKSILSMRPQEKKRESKRWEDLKIERGVDTTVLDEVQEIIELPSEAADIHKSPDLVEVPPEVLEQLTDYVTKIAGTYNDNSFHNFEHASHVTQSVIKLLSRVVAPDTIENGDLKYTKIDEVNDTHKVTQHGMITSDPLTQFAVVFSALIHDVDHSGLPNAQLVKEKIPIADTYKNKSVAEQNSVDIAWELLMEPSYKELRRCIYRNRSELDRFRKLVVNSVMATDIVDKELGALRKVRWEKAFSKDETPEQASTENEVEIANRKVTIVIEHLIQASDVAHTMQHWHVYIKWNERLFHELYAAYQAGRAEKDPSEGWYQGELGFYDFYIIPLAKKLQECNVFGVSSDEYLNYAQDNRAEWATKGQEIVDRYMEKYK
jgi:class 3 adenylate cyclase